MTGERVKRSRLSSWHACLGCRKRKHRCDGEHPVCGECRSRRTTCQYPSDKADFLEQRGSTSRASQNVYSESLSDQLIARPGNTPSGPRARQQKSLQMPRGQELASVCENDHGTGTSSVSNRTALFLGQPHRNVQPLSPRSKTVVAMDPLSSHARGVDAYYGDSSAIEAVSTAQPETEAIQEVRPLHDRFRKSPSTCPQAWHDEVGQDYSLAGGMNQLPERHLADNLVDEYFNRIHYLYPFLHEGSFRAEYENMWTCPEQAPHRPSWSALLNVIFAFGCESGDDIAANKVTETVSPFMDRARTIVLSQVFKRGDLELIQAFLLLCYYLQGTLDLNECWNLVGLMIRTAVSIGLHLNPDSLGVSSVEKEVRKRVWWGCFTLDRTLSMEFGRPPSLQPQDAQDVPYPLPVDDQYIHNTSQNPRQPSNCPSTIEFFIHTIKLAHLNDDIRRDLYSTHRRTPQSDTTDVVVSDQEIVRLVVLDGRLRSWWNAKPDHLGTASLVWCHPIFQRQQAVMQIRYKQSKILLQRRLLLMFSRENIDDEFVSAIAISGSQACLAAARQIIYMIGEQYHQRTLDSLFCNLHYIFMSMEVLLCVRNMDQSKIKMIDSEQQLETADALECGMDILKTASQTSPLAAKYMKTLQDLRETTDQDKARLGQKEGSKRTVIPVQPSHTIMAQGPEIWPELTPLQRESFIGHEQIDLDGLDLDGVFYGS